MKKMRRTLFTLITISLLLGITQSVAYAKSPLDDFDGECPFCDGDELTLDEKYEELIGKALIDEKNLFDDGFITKEVYRLQCKPFEEAIEILKNGTEEEILEGYQSILLYFFENESEKEEVDEEFLKYIIEQMEEYHVEY